MTNVMLWALIPPAMFLLMYILERLFPARAGEPYRPGDWLMNGIGFAVQGVLVPGVGYLLSIMLPEAKGVLQLGFWGAFLLNVIGVDLLYYLQHRAFHEVPWLWKLHLPHHCSPRVDIWATSRNAMVTNFLFVYLWVNPWLGSLCDVPEGFFAGAMLTAALDVFRHANIRVSLPGMSGILTQPIDHHRHHDAEKPFANYGANFLLWDRLFGTAATGKTFPRAYRYPTAPRLSTQLLTPWRA